MSIRECEVWTIGKKRSRRIRDIIRYRHARHVCFKTRQFMQDHEGLHQCACGFRWKKQASDDS